MPESDLFGKLIVNVTTAGTALPVSGALVTVKTAQGPSSDVIATAYTDISGKAGPFLLPAPSRQNSMTPDSGKETSYRYNIDTDAEGYYSVENLFVPIYDGVTALQSIELIPISSDNTVNDIPGDMTRFNESRGPNL